jgi:hypothetical protein
MAEVESDSFDVIEELRDSFQKVGAIRPAIRTKFGVAAGNTRLNAVPEWPVEEREAATLYEHLRIAAADNLHERKGPQWWTEILIQAANWLVENEGTRPGAIAERLTKDFGLSRRTILAYLPQEFKDPVKASAGALGGSALGTLRRGAAGDAAELASVDDRELDLRLSSIGFTRLKSGAFANNHGMTYTSQTFRAIHPEVFDPDFKPPLSLGREEDPSPAAKKREPYSRGTSPQRGSKTEKAFTTPALLLLEYIHAAGLEDVRAEVEFPREGELNSTGQQKGYIADLVSEIAKTVWEAEGVGSSSRDNVQRDGFFRAKGYTVVHISNDLIKDYGTELAEIMATLLVRSRQGSGEPLRPAAGA